MGRFNFGVLESLCREAVLSQKVLSQKVLSQMFHCTPHLFLQLGYSSRVHWRGACWFLASGLSTDMAILGGLLNRSILECNIKRQKQQKISQSQQKISQSQQDLLVNSVVYSIV